MAGCGDDAVPQPAQAYVGKFLSTLKDYPPRQKAAGFNLDNWMQKLKEPGGSSPH